MWRRYRKDYFDGEGEIHPIHEWLVGRRVRWKGDGEVIYDNRLSSEMGYSAIGEEALDSLFPK